MKLSGLKSNHFSIILPDKIIDRPVFRRFSGGGLAVFMRRPETRIAAGSFELTAALRPLNYARGRLGKRQIGPIFFNETS